MSFSLTRKETEVPSDRALQNLHSKPPAFRSIGLQADHLFPQDLEIACTNKHPPWLCSLTQSCAGSVGCSERCPWVHWGHPAPPVALNACGGWMPQHSWISPALEGSFTDNDEFENGDIFQRHTFEWGGNNSVILEPRGGQSDCFKCLVSILCFSYLNAAFVQRSKKRLPVCAVQLHRQRWPGEWPALGGTAVCRKPLNPHDEVLRWAGLGPPRVVPRTQGYITFSGKGTLQASFRCWDGGIILDYLIGPKRNHKDPQNQWTFLDWAQSQGEK